MRSDEFMVENQQMSDLAFSFFSRFINSTCGIKMPASKKTMLEGRLRRRLRALKLASFEDYLEYLSSAKGAKTEIVHILDEVTTNKTDFFREASHFDFLMTKALPALASSHKKIRIWSAGCSTGEEPYTLAMVLSEFGERNGLPFSILATDVSTKVLQKAKRAVYSHDRIEPIPPPFRRKYLLRGRGERDGLIRIKPELRSKVQFMRLNLMDPGFELSEPVQIIFCRNVMIYFDPPTQKNLVRKFCMCLPPDGYLFTGHSEMLYGFNLPLTQVAPTIYRRTQ